MRLKDKVAMITGAASGIGRAIALGFAKEGARLMLTDINEDQLEETRRLTGLDSDHVMIKKASVTDYYEIENLVKEGVGKFGRIDIQANVAGIIVLKNLSDHTLEEWNNVLKVNLTGVFYCIKAVAPMMIAQKYGKIINMGSVGGLVGLEWASYSATKAAVINMTRGLALELAPHSINVSAICPGVIETTMTPPASREAFLKKIPQGRLGRTEDVADAAIFLASEDANFVNGTTLVVDGGATGSYRSH